MALANLVALTLALAPPADVALDAARLSDAWPRERFVKTAAPCLRPAELAAAMEALQKAHPGAVSLEEIGRSVEGRPIRLMTVGSGARRVLLWSQMHGDEPSATPALLDVAAYLLSHRGDAPAKRILEGATLLMIPMLNPDGAERYERRNAQGIDINRDALNLATPEGRLLKSVRDRFRPELGFNLHDQNRRTTVGETGALATISLLAVAGDRKGTLTPGRARAKRVCSAIALTLSRFVPGGVARYDEDWSPRAFGDNLTAWGTPVVLIESGGFPNGMGYEDLTRLNFVALLTVLDELVRDDLAARDDRAYEALPRNLDGSYADVVVRGGLLLQPGATEPYRADVAFDVLESDRSLAGCAGAAGRGRSRIVEVGDGRFLTARESVDAAALLVMPSFAASVRGFGARAWLSPESLLAWARGGLGRVRWHVGEAERGAAEAHAASLAGDGRPQIVVVGLSEPSAALRLEGPPGAARTTLLSDVLDALGAAREGRPSSLPQLLEAPEPGARVGRIAVDRPAGVVLVRPRAPGELTLEGATLEAAFHDGRRVRRAP